MIGILTFHWADDYGAMLQTYALKYYLEKVSKEKVEIIPYAPIKLTGRYSLYPVVGTEIGNKINYSLISYTFIRNVSYLYEFLKRRRCMRNFRKHYLTAKPTVRSERISLKKYSAVFVGSDQVWNPEITVGLDDAYIGNIREKGNCKLIAYGASFGGEVLPEKYHAHFMKSISENFSVVSLREKSAVPFVRSFFQGNVTDVLDPTLLLEQKEWKKIGKLPQEQGYILFIYTEYNEQMIEYLHDLSGEVQRKVVQISMPWPGQIRDWIHLEIKGGPSEFIGFFQNAEYVVTNSFHGMVFSILFEKKFLVFSHSNKNARIENLLDKLSLSSRMIKSGCMPEKGRIEEKIDWMYVKKLLEKEREYSAEFIRNVLVTGRLGEKTEYTGRSLAVKTAYNKDDQGI